MNKVKIVITTGNGFSCIINSVSLEEAMDTLTKVTMHVKDYKILSLINE